MNPCAPHAEPIGQALNYLHFLVADNVHFLMAFVYVGIPLLCTVLHRLLPLALGVYYRMTGDRE